MKKPKHCRCGESPVRWRGYYRRPIGKLNCIWCDIECDRGKRSQIAGCFSCYEQYTKHKDEPLYVKRYMKLRGQGDEAIAPKEIVKGGYLYKRVRKL